MKLLGILTALLISSIGVSQTNKDMFTVKSSDVGILNASYTTTKVYIDEMANDSEPLAIKFAPVTTNQVTEVELWSNLNNRSRVTNDVNNDGIYDSIVPPPAPETKPVGYISGPYPTNGYWNAIPVTNNSNGIFSITTNATKTGVYRLKARYKTTASTNWNWYNGNDHTVVVAPKISRNLVIYEINIYNASATGSTFFDRSFFESLSDSNNPRVNFTHLKKLGINTLWFQPMHPVTDEVRYGNDPGSPYSVKNFFEMSILMTSNYYGTNPLATNRLYSRQAFSNMVVSALSNNLLVLIDVPFNHTAPDVEISQIGIDLFTKEGFNTAGWQSTNFIRDLQPRFFSRNDSTNAYSGPATNSLNIANAPDRNDFGKWGDVSDVFWGTYPYLVTGYPSGQVSLEIINLNSDGFNYSDLIGDASSNGAVTRVVWQYFGSYFPYWLDQTGLPANSSISFQTTNGVAGVRADFAVGLPNQAWEYIINTTRNHKWNFIFMCESVDGGNASYRSSRIFDVLNESIVYPLKSASVTDDYRNIFNDRRISYTTTSLLLNNTTHDEQNYSDPWDALLRYATTSTLDGAPMIMYGQEIGVGDTNGYSRYEFTGNKYVPDFKNWNSMYPQWLVFNSNTNGIKNLYAVYSSINNARTNSAALKSKKRIFLNTLTNTNTSDPKIFSILKYENEGVSPANQDVVFGFINLSKTSNVTNTFFISPQVFNAAGLQTNRFYNVKNISAYTGLSNEFNYRKNAYIWGTNLSGSSILSNGITVNLNRVPTNANSWSNAPYEPLYLKLFDVTP